MSDLRINIEEKYKTALKEKNEIKIKTLRLIKSAIKDKDIAERSADNNDKLTDEKILLLLQSLIKQRNESVEMYKKGGREKLAEGELKEISYIKEFLPAQLSEIETKEIINNIIKNENVQNIKDMGKLMAKIKSDYSGKIDMSVAGRLAKEILN